MVAVPDCIWIVSLQGYIHSRCFDEVALALNAAFKDLGHDVPVIRQPHLVKGIPLVLGPNLLVNVAPSQLPKEMILYNLEQIQPGSPWMNQGYLQLLRNYPVWDYCQQNITELEQLGVSNVALCPIGYHPVLTHIRSSVEKIDILFIGSLNSRRQLMIEQLVLHGLGVRVLFGIYGEERDNLIARSKIILNMHYYPAKVLEMVRLSYLLSNKRFIVSETGSDPESARTYKDGIVFTHYSEILNACVHYINNPHMRSRIAEEGFRIFRRQSLTNSLQRMIGEGYSE